MNKLTVKPTEGSSLVITASFKDIDGADFVPTSCAWTLTDAKGFVINGRSKVPVAITGPSHQFVLQGADLAYAVGSTKGTRVFTIEALYDSTYGEDLPFRAEVEFTVLNTVVDPV